MSAFHDLGIGDPDVRRIKSDLAIAILEACKEKGCGFAEIARQYGITPSELSRIANANYDRFTIDRLVRFLSRLRPGDRIGVEIKRRVIP